MEIRGNCPFCGDIKAHLYYNTTTKCWICFKCGKKGKGKNPIISGELIRLQTIESSSTDKMLPLKNVLSKKGLISNAARRYLVAHHLNPDIVAAKYNLLVEDTWLVLPVYQRGELIYWQKRNLFKKIFLNQTNVEKPVFWANSGRSFERVAIVESYINAIRLSPFINSVCIFGKYMTENQMAEVTGKCKNLYVAFDSGVLHDAISLQKRLYLYGAKKVRPIVWTNYPDGTDFCDVDSDIIKELFK
jgi:hypothetical protein